MNDRTIRFCACLHNMLHLGCCSIVPCHWFFASHVPPLILASSLLSCSSFTLCCMRNSPFRWMTGMSWWYFSNHSLLPGSSMYFSSYVNFVSVCVCVCVVCVCVCVCVCVVCVCVCVWVCVWCVFVCVCVVCVCVCVCACVRVLGKGKVR